MNSSISVTTVLRHTFASYRSRASVLLALAAFTVVPVEVLGALLGKTSIAAAVVVLALDIVLIALFTGAVIRLTADLPDHEQVQSPGKLLRAIRPVLGQLILVGIVASIAIGVLFSAGSLLFLGLTIGAALSGAGLLGAVIVAAVAGTILFSGPGLFLLTIWSVAAPLVVLERPGGLLALHTAKDSSAAIAGGCSGRSSRSPSLSVSRVPRSRAPATPWAARPRSSPSCSPRS